MRRLQQGRPFNAMRLLVAGLLALLVAASATTASAGGWAVTSLDSIPEVTAGESADVGFTILQHGETPAVLESNVGIELVLADGTIQFFEAVSDGEPGHYVATVSFPTAGSYEWHARMDWFGTYELGAIEVAAPQSAADSSAGGSVWPDLRWATLVGSIALAGVAISDFVIARSRRRTAPA
jgi:uncharacterized protein (DUF58 family)